MKITTKKRLQKALKIGAVALAALVLFVLLMGVGASCIKDRYKNRELITCAAEETSATTEETRTIYPSENLIPFPYIKDSFSVNGITFTVNSDGTITANGTATKTAIFVFRSFDFSLLAGVYSVSGVENGSIETYCLQISCDNYTQSWNLYNNAIQIDLKSTSSILLQAVVYVGVTVNNLVFSPMLNIGDTAYPFVPNLDGIYNQAYEAGIEDGGLFHGVKLNATLLYTGWTEGASYTGNPRKTLNGLVFDDVVSFVETNADTSKLWGVALTIEFGKAVPVYHYSFKQTGATEKKYVAAYFDNGESCRCYFTPEAEGGKLVFSGSEYLTSELKDLKITKLVFDRNDMSLYWLRKITLSYEDTAYENGYAIGRQEGEDNAVFTFDNLKSGFFSILDAPFKTIKDALNFEFLGINISNLVLFLLTVIVVVIIIKKAMGK